MVLEQKKKAKAQSVPVECSKHLHLYQNSEYSQKWVWPKVDNFPHFFMVYEFRFFLKIRLHCLNLNCFKVCACHFYNSSHVGLCLPAVFCNKLVIFTKTLTEAQCKPPGLTSLTMYVLKIDNYLYTFLLLPHYFFYYCCVI